MTPIELLHDEGQSVWLDHATRATIDAGALTRAIDSLGVTGLASDLAVLLRAIAASSLYDDALRTKAREGKPAEQSLFEIILEDAVRAADLLRPVWERTSGLDGWISAPLSPFLTATATGALAAAAELSDRALRPNLLVEIPGTTEGLAAVEQAIFTGIAVNVTSLVSVAQYRRAADAYQRGLERRVAAGLDLDVGSVASVSVDAWESHGAHDPFAVGRELYKAYRGVLRSPRWQRVFRIGARPQRVLWTRKVTNQPASEFMYARALAAPFTINVLSLPVLDAYSSRGSLCTVARAVRNEVPTGSARLESEQTASQLQRHALEFARETWRAIAASIASKDAAFDRGRALAS